MSRAGGQLPLSVFGARADAAASERKNLDGFFSVALFMVIIVVVLVALMVGTRIYSRLNAQQSSMDSSRLSMNLLVNNVRANDALDAIEVGQGPEGDALVLVERLRSGTYETRIYLYQGHVVEQYAVAAKPYEPEKATPIVPSETFSFSFEDGLLTITTDAGSAEVALRSVRGGA